MLCMQSLIVLACIHVGECLQELKVSEKPIETVGTATRADVTTTPEQDFCSIEVPEEDAHADIMSPNLSVPEKIAILDNRFENLVENTSIYLSNKEAKESGFLARFQRGVAFLSGARRQFPPAFSKENRTEILNAKSVDSILSHFSDFWDFINFHLLKVIINKFGDSTLKKAMEKYSKDMKHFCAKTPVYQYQPWAENIPADFSTVVSKLKINEKECTLQNLIDHRFNIAESSAIQPLNIRLTGAKPGSVIVTLSLPRVLTSLFVKTFDTQKSTDDIEELTIDGIPLEEYQHLLKVFLI